MDALHLEPCRSASWDWGHAHRVCLRESTRLLGPGPTAEDAAQEAVVRAWRQHRHCRDPSNPAPWLRRIVFNEAMRLASRRIETGLDDIGDVSIEPADATTAFYIRQIVNELSPLDRRLLFLQHWADLPVHQIAVSLQMPEGTVKIRLHRARAHLRRLMEDDP